MDGHARELGECDVFVEVRLDVFDHAPESPMLHFAANLGARDDVG